MLQCVTVRCRVLQCVAVCCSALQSVAVRCSVLQCVARIVCGTNGTKMTEVCVLSLRQLPCGLQCTCMRCAIEVVRQLPRGTQHTSTTHRPQSP